MWSLDYIIVYFITVLRLHGSKQEKGPFLEHQCTFVNIEPVFFKRSLWRACRALLSYYPGPRGGSIRNILLRLSRLSTTRVWSMMHTFENRPYSQEIRFSDFSAVLAVVGVTNGERSTKENYKPTNWNSFKCISQNNFYMHVGIGSNLEKP